MKNKAAMGNTLNRFRRRPLIQDAVFVMQDIASGKRLLFQLAVGKKQSDPSPLRIRKPKEIRHFHRLLAGDNESWQPRFGNPLNTATT